MRISNGDAAFGILHDLCKIWLSKSKPNSSITDCKFKYAAHALLSKAVNVPGAKSPQSARENLAWEKFWASERIMLKHQYTYQRREQAANKKVACSAIIQMAAGKIATVLGEFNVDEFRDECDFSGGASTQRNRSESSTKNKYADQPDLTPDALSIYKAVRAGDPCLPAPGKLVPGSIGFTVPKNKDTDRLCFKEPQGNMFLQKGLGRMIRRRLRSSGINLNNQSINGHLSNDLNYATVDLSDASNRISFAVVCDLLSCAPEWLHLLVSCRSHYVGVPNPNGQVHYHKLEMFSGMGNGFTFELESLLFYSICWAVCKYYGHKGTISVYGDDIIIPCRAFHSLKLVFAHLSWRVNATKSFWSGPFRESCGYHWLSGTYITPVYVKDQTFKSVGDWYWLHNSLLLLSQRLACSDTYSAVVKIREVLATQGYLNAVPSTRGLRSGVFMTFDEAHPLPARGKHWRKLADGKISRSYVAKCLVPVKQWYQVSQSGAALSSVRTDICRIAPFVIAKGRLHGSIFHGEPSVSTSVPQGHVEWCSIGETFKWCIIPFEEWG